MPDFIKALRKLRAFFITYFIKYVDHLYVKGNIQNVFSNGLITYNKDFREDGANIKDVNEWKLEKQIHNSKFCLK